MQITHTGYMQPLANGDIIADEQPPLSVALYAQTRKNANALSYVYLPGIHEKHRRTDITRKPQSCKKRLK